MRRSLLVWSVLAVLYAGFRLWYDGGGGPLTPAEVEHYTSILEARGVEPARLARLRAFLASDTGADFVMANLIRSKDAPEAQQNLDRYMAHMVPELFKRACHPVLVGPVVADALDAWGVENAERWTLVGLVRYRSRRDVMEIVANPAFADAHEFKEAAMAQTLAVPVEPTFSLANPRWAVAGVLVTVGAVLQLVLRGRSR